jgi:(2R)-ethylmalonyl-CoA mutase
MQQILAYETDLLEYGDIFDGSKEIEAKVEALKRGAGRTGRIDAMGGASPAIDYMKRAWSNPTPKRLAAIESGEQVVVGVNAITEGEPSPLGRRTGIDPDGRPAVEPTRSRG